MSMHDYEFWFVVGSQFLYGEEVLETVAARAAEMAAALNASGSLPCLRPAAGAAGHKGRRHGRSGLGNKNRAPDTMRIGLRGIPAVREPVVGTGCGGATPRRRIPSGRP